MSAFRDRVRAAIESRGHIFLGLACVRPSDRVYWRGALTRPSGVQCFRGSDWSPLTDINGDTVLADLLECIDTGTWSGLVMDPAFRIVFLCPHPILGTRIPIGAMVRAAGSTSFVPALNLPGEDYLGAPMYWTLRLICHALEHHTDFDALPETVGPLISLGDVIDFPFRDTDPISWIQKILPGSDPVDGSYSIA